MVLPSRVLLHGWIELQLVGRQGIKIILVIPLTSGIEYYTSACSGRIGASRPVSFKPGVIEYSFLIHRHLCLGGSPTLEVVNAEGFEQLL